MRHVEQCTSCYEIVRRKETHVTRKRRDGRKRSAAVLTPRESPPPHCEVTTRKGGWGGMGGGQHRCGWLWMEWGRGKWVKEEYVARTQTTWKSPGQYKSGRPSGRSEGLRSAHTSKCCFLCLGFSGKVKVGPSKLQNKTTQFLLMISNHDEALRYSCSSHTYGRKIGKVLRSMFSQSSVI